MAFDKILSSPTHQRGGWGKLQGGVTLGPRSYSAFHKHLVWFGLVFLGGGLGVTAHPEGFIPESSTFNNKKNNTR